MKVGTKTDSVYTFQPITENKDAIIEFDLKTIRALSQCNIEANALTSLLKNEATIILDTKSDEVSAARISIVFPSIGPREDMKMGYMIGVLTNPNSFWDESTVFDGRRIIFSANI